MAQRLATEYKQIVLELTSQQLQEFMNFFKAQNYLTEARVFDNGDTEFILFDNGNEVPLPFRNIGMLYQFEGSYIIKDIHLAQVMRKAISEFKGSALVHRVYETYVMEYRYQRGNVMKIIERKDNGTDTLVYEFQDTVGKLTHLFEDHAVEDQIAWVKLQIDMLLDQRCKNCSLVVNKEIDQQLTELTNELFILEA